MDSVIKNYKNSIGYVLFKKVYLTYFIILIFFMIYQIFSQYENTKNEVFKKTKKVETIYKELLTNYAIEENNLNLDKISKTIFATTEISGISIIDYNSNFKFLKGNIPENFLKELSQKKEKLYYHDKKNLFYHEFLLKNLDKEFAKVVFYIKKEDITKIVWDSVLLILINMILSMIILWILFMIFTDKYLIKPLNMIIEATNKFDIEEHEVIEINLGKLQKNELYKLSSMFNKMSKRINEAYINMQQLTMIREIQKNKLEDQKSELIQANKSKDDFLANMSHELKTPLNSINVISDVMMKNKANNLDEKQIKSLEIINKCGKDLLFLINDVLDISKLEAGEIILNNNRINLKSLMKTIYEMFYPQTKSKDIDFVLKVDDSLEDIFSDEDRIKQIVKNLLSNALKFTNEGKISLIVKDEEENVRIIVIDEGIGIPEDKLKHIFDRFKQVDSSTTRKYGGTGLGLAICKELSHLLKGDISVSSILNAGSTFEVVISKNKELLSSLDILSFKNELPNSNKIENEELPFIEFDNEKESIKEEILVYNNEPIGFFDIIVGLNKKFIVKQSSNLNEIKAFYKNQKTKVLINLENINDDEMQIIKDSFDGDIIFIYSGVIDLKLAQNGNMILEKPLDQEKINKIGEK